MTQTAGNDHSALHRLDAEMRRLAQMQEALAAEIRALQTGASTPERLNAMARELGKTISAARRDIADLRRAGGDTTESGR